MLYKTAQHDAPRVTPSRASSELDAESVLVPVKTGTHGARRPTLPTATDRYIGCALQLAMYRLVPLWGSDTGFKTLQDIWLMVRLLSPYASGGLNHRKPHDSIKPDQA